MVGINAAGFGFSVEEVVDYFPMVKWVDGEVERNQSPGRDRSSRWCAIWEVGSRGRFLASATMIVFLNVMKTTLPRIRGFAGFMFQPICSHVTRSKSG